MKCLTNVSDAHDELQDSQAALEDALSDLQDSLDEVTGDTDDDADISDDTADDADSESFTKGSVSGNTYENKYIGLGFEAPEGWTFFDDSQLAELTGITTDMIDNESVNNALENGIVVFDMYAMDATGTSVNIVIENLGAIYGTLLDENGYFDISESQLTDSLKAGGALSVETDREDISFAGKDATALFVSADMGGVTLYEELVAVKCGKYMALICVAGTDSDYVLSIADSFYGI